MYNPPSDKLGTGTDAQPYFRIFNPTTQSEKFDPDGMCHVWNSCNNLFHSQLGAYIKKYVPELASLKGKTIHDPYAALGLKGVEKLGCVASTNADLVWRRAWRVSNRNNNNYDRYVKPIVEHKVARDRALAAYSKAMKKTI